MDVDDLNRKRQQEYNLTSEGTWLITLSKFLEKSDKWTPALGLILAAAIGAMGLRKQKKAAATPR